MIVVNSSKLVVCSQIYRAKKVILYKKKVISYKIINFILVKQIVCKNYYWCGCQEIRSAW